MKNLILGFLLVLTGFVFGGVGLESNVLNEKDSIELTIDKNLVDYSDVIIVANDTIVKKSCTDFNPNRRKRFESSMTLEHKAEKTYFVFGYKDVIPINRKKLRSNKEAYRINSGVLDRKRKKWVRS